MSLNTEKVFLSKYFCDKPKFNQTPNISVRTIKNQVRSMETTKTSGMPKDMEDLKKLKRRTLALEFMEGYAKGTIKSKAKFIKSNKISIQTLNRALGEMGMGVIPRENKEEEISSSSEEVATSSEDQEEVKKSSKSPKKSLKVKKAIGGSEIPPDSVRKGGDIVENEITLNDKEEYGFMLNNTEKHNIV